MRLRNLLALALLLTSIGPLHALTFELPPPGDDVVGQTFDGSGEAVKEERTDYTDKADPIREHDCIYCMACVSVCPPEAIKVDQSNMEAHDKAAGTYVKLTAGANPHAHD